MTKQQRTATKINKELSTTKKEAMMIYLSPPSLPLFTLPLIQMTKTCISKQSKAGQSKRRCMLHSREWYAVVFGLYRRRRTRYEVTKTIYNSYSRRRLRVPRISQNSYTPSRPWTMPHLNPYFSIKSIAFLSKGWPIAKHAHPGWSRTPINIFQPIKAPRKQLTKSKTCRPRMTSRQSRFFDQSILSRMITRKRADVGWRHARRRKGFCFLSVAKRPIRIHADLDGVTHANRSFSTNQSIPFSRKTANRNSCPPSMTSHTPIEGFRPIKTLISVEKWPTETRVLRWRHTRQPTLFEQSNHSFKNDLTNSKTCPP